MTLKGDLIEALPQDDSPYNEQLANMMFKKETASNLFKELKESIVIIALFIVFSSQQLEDMIKNIYPPAGNSKIVLTAIKCVLVVFVFYIFKNFEFARTK
ncbi:hypothetical protein EBS02_11320 [bacterium]|nr:hypothetical protein [bacterium]